MKQIFLAAILSLSFLTGFAQVKIGVKAGSMLTNLATKGIGLNPSGIYTDPKLSYLAGAVVALPIYSKGYLRAELLYSNKGFKSNLTVIRGAIPKT